MESKEQALEKLLKQPNLSTEYIHWFEEGGGEVIRVNYDWWVLFEVPQYGGNPHLVGTFHKNNLNELVDTAFSWT